MSVLRRLRVYLRLLMGHPVNKYLEGRQTDKGKLNIGFQSLSSENTIKILGSMGKNTIEKDSLKWRRIRSKKVVL